ncbi:MAG: hypothetical protein EOP56_15230 [Sphingobacteriales bacterium]|nr:MAG: hypothetical protein EOP56_15230 [Sphingobacteriales bacterium]
MAENSNNFSANVNDPSFNRGLGSQSDDLQHDIASGDQRDSTLQEVHQDDSDYDEDLDVRYPRNNQKTPANPGNQEEGSPAGRSGSSSAKKPASKVAR